MFKQTKEHKGYIFRQDGLVVKDDNKITVHSNKNGYAIIPSSKRNRRTGRFEETCHSIQNRLFLPNYDGFYITDHLDGDRMNFHIQNLNPCNTKLNNLNKTKARGYDKITDDKYRLQPNFNYQSRLTYNGVRYKFGQHETAEEASQDTKRSRSVIYWREWDRMQTESEMHFLKYQVTPKDIRRVIEKTIYFL